MVNVLEGAHGVVSVNERQKKSTPPPLLYDLTSASSGQINGTGYGREHSLAQSSMKRIKC